MACPSLVFTFAIVYSLLQFKFQSQGASSLDYGRVKAMKMDSQKVNLSVYYETLNKSSASFIISNLAQIFDKGLFTILNLKLVPLGNAKVNTSNNGTAVRQVIIKTFPSIIIIIFFCFPSKFLPTKWN